jgi:2-polyprenyl-3-methyl-5-hydroxy-6-metoxy-1,4-benzoquinol methylase
MGGYAKTKVGGDWVYPLLCEYIEPGTTVLDLGAGIGLLGLLLHALDRGHRTHGIEWDERKVSFAHRLAPDASTCSMQQGNLLDAAWPKTDVVVLVDVLHYFPIPVQQKLIQRIAEHLEPGGVLYLREMNLEAQGRARITRTIERLAVALRWNRATRVHWRNIQAIQEDLVHVGLQPALCLSGSHFLDGNCLISAMKPPVPE